MDLPLSWMQSFVAVAEQLHFGRAAAQVHRSRSAVSRHVRALEDALGVPLFRRTSRQVRLTAEGRALYADAAAPIAALDAALRAVRARPSDVRVGYVSAAADGIVPRLAAAVDDRTPPLHLSLGPATSDAQVTALLDGGLDVGIQWALGTPVLPAELAWIPLHTRGLAAALPSTHRLAGFPQVTLPDLAADTWLMAADASDHRLREGFVAVCRAHGFTPTVAAAATGLEAQLTLVAAGRGICVAPAGTGADRDGVVLSLLDGVTAQLVAVTRATPGEPVNTVLEALGEAAASGL